ncbi:hydrophobic surface binding protein [Peniophora sp. CONT]|nr:hydrophobic surface binding protein [Peniophora sp. CONT]
MKFSAGLAALLAVAVSASPVKRDAATVESDIAAISAQVTTLNNAITTFGTSKALTDALAIHSDAQTLEGLITKATTDTNASDAFTEDEGAAILTAIQGLQPNIVTALQDLDSQHDNFASQPIAGLDGVVESDLNTLNTDTTAFENALLAKAPADIQAQAQSSIDAINSAFATAIATYAS